MLSYIPVIGYCAGPQSTKVGYREVPRFNISVPIQVNSRKRHADNVRFHVMPGGLINLQSLTDLIGLLISSIFASQYIGIVISIKTINFIVQLFTNDFLCSFNDVHVKQCYKSVS